MPTFRFGAIALGLALVAAACGGDGEAATTLATTPPPTTTAAQATTTVELSGTSETTEATGSDVDACVLVDADDAASVLGSPAQIDTTSIAGLGETSVCAWITESDALLVVTLFEGRQFYGGDLRGDGDAIDFGDEGYIVVEPTFGGVGLDVVKGDWVLGLSAAPFGIVDVEGLPAAMMAVARQATDRLP